MLFGSMAFYIYIRIKGRRIRFFFFWVYVLPILIGVIIQTANYGLSLIPPCLLIALTGLMSTIQNELIFKDKLTGLYNRYYLDQLGEELRKDKSSEYTFLMIDINDFKSINDKFGHLEGDRAIVDTANIIKKAIGSSGAGIRYAGDEFVIVLSTRTQIDTDIFVTNIRKGFDEYNSEEDHKYELHISIGQSIVNMNEISIDEVMNRIDKLMYEDKRRYYKKRDSANNK
jgi:diguanylate cyclase (GGDEF)-like protein